VAGVATSLGLGTLQINSGLRYLFKLPETRLVQQRKVLWGLVQFLLAVSLLFAGGLEALQTASVAAAFPFIFVMLFAIVSLMKALKQEKV